jgi:hypothetical protein
VPGGSKDEAADVAEASQKMLGCLQSK